MKGYSLHIGLNYVDPNHYGGWDGKLNACEYDAYDMQSICKSLGYNTNILIREQATRNNVLDLIKDFSKRVKPGDIFYISFSAHGAQVPDLNNDEEDAMDETWCLYDGQLIDDELKKLWSFFEDGVRILVTSDSCHSGSILKAFDLDEKLNKNSFPRNPRLMPSEIKSRTYYENKEFYDSLLKNLESEDKINVKASVKLISGCQDHEYSYDGPYNGVFTAHLKKIWNGGKFKRNYKAFHSQIVNSIKSANGNQTPNLMDIGKNDAEFNNQSPFKV